MIARIWSGAVRTPDADDYAGYIQETGFAEYGQTPGNRGAWLLRREDQGTTEFIALSLWESVDAIRAFAGEDIEAAVLYPEDERYLIGGESRTVLKFHPRFAPIKAAVFPLVKKDGMPDKAEAIYRELKKKYNVFYDEKGAIGRRYRRQDEAGTPFGITVDGQSLEDGSVTVRDRDTLAQERVDAGRVVEYVRERVG